VKPPPVRDASLSKQLKQTIKHLCKNSSVVCLYIVCLCHPFVQCTFVNQSQCKYTELFFKSQGFRRKFLNFFIIYRKTQLTYFNQNPVSGYNLKLRSKKSPGSEKLV